MEITTSNKGSSKLCYEGYSYTKKRSTKSTITWECSKRRSQNCKGTLTSDLEITQVKCTTDHTQVPDPFQIAALKLKAEIKSSVEVNRGNTNQIVTDKLFKYPVQVRAAAGQKDSLKRQVRRLKKGNNPTEPESISTIPHPLPEQYMKTSPEEDRQFLIYDNGSESNRVLVFSSDIGLQLLAEADTWFMDGTHSTCPTRFSNCSVLGYHLVILMYLQCMHCFHQRVSHINPRYMSLIICIYCINIVITMLYLENVIDLLLLIQKKMFNNSV